MVRVSSKTRSSINVNSQGSSSVSVASNTNSDVNTNQDGNSQRARSWAVGEGLIDGEDYSAKHYAQEAKESADIASSGVEAIEQARDNALATIDDEKTEAIADMETAKEEKIGEIEDTAAGFEDDLEALTTRAETAATRAESEATTAYLSASAANFSKNAAAESATSAATNANLAENYKNDAYTYANNAASSKNAAKSYADNAKEDMTTALNAAAEARTSANSASQSATTATNAKNVAEIARDAAGNYAQQAEQAKEDIEAELDNYVQTSELTTVLADYVLSSDLSTTLADYATQQWVQTNANALYSAMQNWVNNQGFALSSNLASVATSGSYNDLSNKPTIPDAQVQADWDVTDTTSKAYIKNKPYIPSGVVVDQTFDGTSANAQSGVAIIGAKFLQNTATATNSLTIYGATNNQNHSILIGYSTVASGSNCTIIGNTATTGGSYATALGYFARANAQYTTAIGNSSLANYQDVTAVGHSAQATAAGTLAVGSNSTASAQRATSVGYSSQATQYQATALGYEAKATANSALQIGTGTNSTANTLQVGSYTLLNTSTGLIPDARLSTNIARTSDLSGYVQASNGNMTFVNAGTEGDILYTDSTTGEFYGVVIGQSSTYGTGVTIGAGNSLAQNGYMLNLSLNGFAVIDASNIGTALLTVSNNNLAVNGSEVALQSDIPDISTKQDTLVSGTNIKTINNTSILGSGDIDTSEIFVAEYGDTSFADVLAAYNAGKTIKCIYIQSTALLTYYLAFYDGSYFVFMSEKSISQSDDIQYAFLRLDSNDNWTHWVKENANNTLSNVSSISSNSAVQTALNGKADTDLSNLSATGKTVIDGQWVYNKTSIANGTRLTTTAQTYDISSYLPNDSYDYEVLLGGSVTSGSSSGNRGYVTLKSDISSYVELAYTITRSNSTVTTYGNCIIAVGTGRQIIIAGITNPNNSTYILAIEGYRRIGTNS